MQDIRLAFDLVRAFPPVAVAHRNNSWQSQNEHSLRHFAQETSVVTLTFGVPRSAPLSAVKAILSPI